MAKQAPILWLPEEEAAKVVSRSPRVLRAKVKAGTWPVQFRTVNGRNYQYAEVDLQNVFSYHRA